MMSSYRWALTALRDLGLNVFGFLLMFAGAALLGGGVRTGMEKFVERGHLWLALAFVAAAVVWATLFGLVRKQEGPHEPGGQGPAAVGGRVPARSRRGALLVLFRVAVLYQIFAKGREILKRDE
jgi:membrane protein implicated in regulation of membrane protease activity